MGCAITTLRAGIGVAPAPWGYGQGRPALLNLPQASFQELLWRKEAHQKLLIKEMIKDLVNTTWDCSGNGGLIAIFCH